MRIRGLELIDASTQLLTMFTAAKDSMASSAARAFVNQRIVRYGQLNELRIDSRSKSITATGSLHGDGVPITVHVAKYMIEDAGAKKFIRLTGCTGSRPWLQNLLADFVEQRRIELPAWAGAAF